MNTLNNKNILKTCRIYDLEDKPKFLHNGIYYDKSKYIELYKALLETHNVVKLNKFYLSAQKHYLKNSNELNKLELDIITLFFSENSLSIPKIENKKSKNIILAFMLSSLITIILIALIALAFFDIAPRVNNHDETVEVIEKDDGSFSYAGAPPVMSDEQKKALESMLQEKNEDNKYFALLNDIVDKTKTQMDIATDLSFLVEDVWYNSLYKVNDDTTNKYVLDSTGDFVQESVALQNLINSKYYKDKITNLKDRSTKIKKLNRKLQDSKAHGLSSSYLNSMLESYEAYIQILISADLGYDYDIFVADMKSYKKDFDRAFNTIN